MSLVRHWQEFQWQAALAAAVLTILIALVLQWLATWLAKRAQRRREAAIVDIGTDYVRHMLVPDGNGGAMHLDWLLLTPRGVLVLESRDVDGNVFGSEQMSEWTVMRGDSRATFANPLGPLYDRLAVLKRLVPELPVDGRVVFSQRAVFPKGMPAKCLRIDSLAAEYPKSTGSAGTASMQASWQRLCEQLTPNPIENLKPLN